MLNRVGMSQSPMSLWCHAQFLIAPLGLLQLTGTVPAFLSTIGSLVELELESNQVHIDAY